jgi:glyoxylase-like metal-dependent hydrolase (beta-lactamase superfamily II)
MKTLIAIGTLAALAAFSCSLHAQQQQRGQQQRAPQQQATPPPQGVGAQSANPGAGFGPAQLTTFKVRDNFYMIRSGQSGNCSVLIADDGVVLIDNKFEMDHDGIIAKLREITDKPILYVINTHMHGDHSGGNAKNQALGAKVIASENARFQMGMTQTAGLPTITLEDHMRLYHGEFILDLYYLGRGHTDGDIVVHLPKQNMIFTGDLFATWDPYVTLIDYPGGGSLREWTRTLERIEALPFDTVIPGHGGATDRAHLATYHAQLVRMQDMVREMNRSANCGRRGTPPAEAAQCATTSRERIQKMLETEFGWSGFVTTLGLDGVIREMQ